MMHFLLGLAPQRRVNLIAPDEIEALEDGTVFVNTFGVSM
jgi:hypothetical protein